MAIKIEIVSTEINQRSGISNKSGKPYSMREQYGYLHREGQQYPDKIKLTLEDVQAPYQPGFYILADQSFYSDRYESLSVKPILIQQTASPVKA